MSSDRALRVAFRVDASLQMGSGHVMRCLTLADALRAHAADCIFVCRRHPRDLVDLIRSRGYAVHSLATAASGEGRHAAPYESWLGAPWSIDAAQTRDALGDFAPDWLVVDHYGVEERWERALRPLCNRLMVIDDLADRNHSCDLLLDQTYGRNQKEYESLVPTDCVVLTGSHYALLRSEFSRLRPTSLVRREESRLERLLVMMGGSDPHNITGLTLDALQNSRLPDDCHVTVVIGGQNPWTKEVRRQASTLRWSTEVKVDLQDVAVLMADSDLAVGAAGTSAWERCCVGLPTLMVVLAENQWSIARSLHDAGAAILLGTPAEMRQRLAFSMETLTGARLLALSERAATVTDGAGALRVTAKILGLQ